MKINVLDENGIAVTRDMTAEEEAQYLTDETAFPQGKTDSERIAELEEALALLIGGVTE